MGAACEYHMWPHKACVSPVLPLAELPYALVQPQFVAGRHACARASSFGAHLMPRSVRVCWKQASVFEHLTRPQPGWRASAAHT